MSQYLFIEKYRQIYFCFHFQEWGVQMWELDQKEGWAPKNRYFWIAVLEKTPESPSDCKEIKAVLKEILKEINTKYSLEGLMLKLQYFGHLMQRADSLEKILMLGKIEGKRRRRQQSMNMVRLHHWLKGHKFEQVLEDSGGQRSLTCCSPWGHKESDTLATE